MSQARLQSPHESALAVCLPCQFMVPSTLLRAASVALVLASLMGSARGWASDPHRLGLDVSPRLQMQELALVVLQPGGAPPPSSTRGGGQRTCAAVQCPLVALPVGAFFPVWRQAELCIQETYVKEHLRNVVSLNKGWFSLTGRRAPEISALRCLKKEGFTGKSGMAEGEPDLWDFTDRTMYEITTPSGMAFRRGKLTAQLKLANDICSKKECGGVTFVPGPWSPKGPCYAIGGELYIRVENGSGILVYHVLRDATKQAAVATTLTTLAALLKSGLVQRLGGALGQRLGRKGVPGYTVASALAVIILLESGRAEAKVGFGGDEPLAALFKSLEQQGTPVPPEIRQMLENEPKLKRALEDAMTGKKGLTRAQKELNDKVLQIINGNQERFSVEDLTLLLGMTQLAGAALPASDVTAQTLRNALEAKKAGKSGSGDNADSGGRGGLSAAAKAKVEGAPAAKRKVFDALFIRTGKGRPALTDDEVNLFFSILPSSLGDDEASKLISQLQPWMGGSIAEVLSGLAAVVALDMGPTAQRRVFDAAFSGTGKAAALTDEEVSLFLSIVPPDLSGEEVAVLAAQIQPWVGGSVADVLEGLTTAVAAMRLPGTGAKLPKAASGDAGGSDAAPPDSREASKELMAALASIVRLGDYSRVDEGTLYFESKRDELETGSTLTKTLLAVLGGRRVAAVVTFKVTGTGNGWVQVMLLGSSVWVDAEQNPWGQVDELVSNESVRLFWYDARTK